MSRQKFCVLQYSLKENTKTIRILIVRAWISRRLILGKVTA